MKSFSMSFKELLLQSAINDTKLYTEMSLRTSSNLDTLSNPNNHDTMYDSIINDGRFIQTNNIGLDVDIYSYKGQSDTNIAFIIKKKIAAIIEYEHINQNCIKIRYMNRNPNFKGIMTKIFIDILLKEYNEIISDNIQTSEAFLFYRRLFLIKNNLYEMYLFWDETGREEKIKNVEQMNITYGDADGNYDISYKIKRL